ncbi:hypothetical protein CAEBREN_13418 [Caenorhabditis brenneri]|uniref:Uncharacterized protein n=1 Tax=Caenorhabditis brenneri TaxID=135651 RepID=G0MBI5_CAEBE|nr:hypothetical protein CAEBREN_13418 [Caenorhabditis brenneri]
MLFSEQQVLLSTCDGGDARHVLFAGSIKGLAHKIELVVILLELEEVIDSQFMDRRFKLVWLE